MAALWGELARSGGRFAAEAGRLGGRCFGGTALPLLLKIAAESSGVFGRELKSGVLAAKIPFKVNVLGFHGFTG